jgi:hypothetical protein
MALYNKCQVETPDRTRNNNYQVETPDSTSKKAHRSLNDGLSIYVKSNYTALIFVIDQ